MADRVDPLIVAASGDTRPSRAAEADRAAAAAEQAVADAAKADPSLLRDPNVRAIAAAALRTAYPQTPAASPRRQTAALAENEGFTLSQATLNELNAQGRQESTARTASPQRPSRAAPENLLPPGFDQATPQRRPAGPPRDEISEIITDIASVETSVGRVIRREDGMPNATDRFLRELRSNPSFAAAAGTRDLDGDGQVTRDELKSHTDRILERSLKGDPVQQIALQLGTREEMAHVRQKLTENRPADADAATHIAQAPRDKNNNGRGGI